MASLAADGPGLVDAARNGDLGAVRSLLKGGADPNQAAPDGSTAVHWAVHRDNLEMLNALLDAGARPDRVTRYKIAPLTLAAQNGNAALVERLLAAGANPDTVSEEGQTALMTAARNGSVAAVRALLRRGAQVGLAESFRGQTALMFAAGEGNTAAAELLLEFGAKLNERSKGGYTPLLFAVRNNRYETVKFLLAQGANVNDRIPDGTSALSMAILNADFDLAALLLEAGADPNVPDPRGHPLHVVVWLHQPGAPPDFAMNGEDPQPVPRPRGKLSHLDMARLLLAKGADPNATITWGERRFGSGGVARNPANLNIGRHYLAYEGATPFYLAARNGDEPMMRVLAAAGADPTKPTRFGVTPLMAAACLDYYEGETAGPFSGVPEAQRLEAVKLALALGNKINARTTFGDYPMIGTPEDTLLQLSRQLPGPGRPGHGRPALRRDDRAARRGDLQPAINRQVPDRAGRRGERQEPAGVDAADDRGRPVHRQRPQDLPRVRRDSARGAGRARSANRPLNRQPAAGASPVTMR